MKKIYNFNFNPKTKPYPHQVEAIEYVTNHEFVALFDEQGLGKTKIVIESLCKNMSTGVIDGALIICNKQLIENWKYEIETHSYLNYIILRGTKNEKGLKYMGFAHFYITNYESIINDFERISMFLKIKNLAIVLDESHKIKNPDTKISKSILLLRNKSKKRIIISGTPIANKPIDLWAQFYFLDSGKLLGDNYNQFKKKYTIKIKDLDLTEYEEKFKNLKDLILSNSIRRLKNEVLELPGKIYHEKYIEITGLQKKLYDKLNHELYIEITNLNGDVIIDESSELLKKLLRLVQLASNPFLIDKSYNETPAKFISLDKLIDEIIKEKEKVIIWSSFVENIKILYKRYQMHRALMLHGEMPIELRNKIVKKFQLEPDYKILIANPAVAREGLTLTAANNSIYVDRNFNLVDYLQSQDRIHRLSQTKECKIYKLIAKNTIDEYIDEILTKKNELAQYIQGDFKSIQNYGYMTTKQLINIMGVK
jgi:SNF2 family DNA or RNA helicase